jgi:peptidoglycan/LPS O-acetylase OafA/YrhL
LGIRYRHDVDGLRAVAIIPVVLYHFHVPFLPGGYVGVDVFFVISGFLITSLIHSEIAAGRFTYLDFYERRIRRIFPALLVLLFATMAAGFYELLPWTFANYGKAIAATGGFLSNVEFWREAGYFDAAAAEKPLLHTWSLAVEEQFYLVFPPLMLLVARFAKARYTLLFWAISAASLALGIWAVRYAPDFAFYWLPTRMWELLLGSLIAVGSFVFAPHALRDGAMAVLGIGMILSAALFYNEATPFPGLAALLPCLGAGLVIVAGQTRAPAVNRALSWAPMVFIGKISYSLYLWHWPVYVFAHYRLARELTLAETVLLIAVSVALAVLSWRYVEQPFRKRNGVVSRPALFKGAGAAMAVAMASGLFIAFSDGVPRRFDRQTLALLAPASEPRDLVGCFGKVEQSFARRMCLIGDPSAPAPSFLVWGDSHAMAMSSGVASAARRVGVSGEIVVQPGCAPLLGADRVGSPDRPCRKHNDRVLHHIESSSIQTIILIARWAGNAEGRSFGDEPCCEKLLVDDESRSASVEENNRVFLRALSRTIDGLRSRGRQVVVVNAIPESRYSVPDSLARNFALGKSLDIGVTQAEFELRNRRVSEALQWHAREVQIVHPHRLLCTRERCDVLRDGTPLYKDYDHVSVAGAELVGTLLDPILAATRPVLARSQ